MRDEYIFETVPVFLLIADENLQIIHSNRVAESVIGPVDNCALRDVLDASSVACFEEYQRGNVPGGAPVHLLAAFFRRNGASKKIAGLVDMVAWPDGPPLLRFTACYDIRCGHWLEDLVLSEEILRGFVQTSSEAMWCIEFSEPVDIGLSDLEIVRQVFENDCRWLLCNDAMARLYHLPDGLDMNLQPVSLYFPRSPENEVFVLQIINSGFAVDNAPSIDFRHDGSVAYIENTVRCTIVDGRLVRMWGTVRDVTDFRQAQNRLVREAEAVRNILSALPDAILVIDRNRRLVAVNPSFETLLGWNGESFLGRDVQSIIDLERPLPGGRRWYGFDQQRWLTTVKTKFNTLLCCEAQISPIGEEAPDHFVLSLRPIPEPGELSCQEGCDDGGVCDGR
ncbi:MAG: PAS domain-containing protein [Betaproteobacteria bacterium]|nr:PAS domain-containing protein [Betaproteobacteria bacterium]